MNEVRYRYRLAVNYLRETNDAFGRGNWRGTIANAQLSAENAAKAVIMDKPRPLGVGLPAVWVLGFINSAVLVVCAWVGASERRFGFFG
jgi:hypothetical protein